MEKSNKQGVLLDNELQINRSIGMVLYMGCIQLDYGIRTSHNHDILLQTLHY